MLLSDSALMSILWSFLKCLKALRVIVAFSAEMEMSEYCIQAEEGPAVIIVEEGWP